MAEPGSGAGTGRLVRRNGWPGRHERSQSDGEEIHRRGHPDEALQTVLALRRRKLAFTADLLGEAVISEAEADLYQQTCLALSEDWIDRSGPPMRFR